MARGDFKLTTNPERQPGVDFITRSGQGPFVDTGVDVILRSQPGMPVQTERVYLSAATITQMAQLVGVLGDSDNSNVREQSLIAHGKLEGLKEGLGERLDDVARTLDRWLDDAGLSRHRDSGAPAE